VDRVEPAYVVWASSTTRARVASSSRFGRNPAAIAMDQAARAGRAIALDQPPRLADRQLKVLRRRLHGQLRGQDMAQDVQALLGSAVQRDRLPRFHGNESDKVAVPLARTESLSLDTLISTG
jgi:hypothetical protein